MRLPFIVAMVAVMAGLEGCAMQSRYPYPASAPASAPPPAPATYPTPPQMVPPVAIQPPRLMVFGGPDHKVYLGCLNCDPSTYDSIFNKGGPYGHCPGPFDDNLYCRGPFKEFGSSGPFHDQSACGSSASDPPVIVDQNGRYYGRFSIGGPFGHGDSVCASVFGSFRNERVCVIVQQVCQSSS
jgi:hypothetical protein